MNHCTMSWPDRGLRERVSRPFDFLRGDGRGWALIAIASGWLFMYGARITVPVVLPGIKATFGLDNTAAGIVVSVIWGVYGLSQFPVGIVSDRVGDRPAIIAGLVVTTASVVAVSLAPSFPVILLAMSVVGLGNGLFNPTRGTILSSMYPDNASTAISVTLAVGSLGAAGIPFVAGAVAERVGWRLAIGSLAPALLVTSLLALQTVPSTDHVDDGGGSTRDRVRELAAAVGRPAVALGVSGKTLRVFVYQGLAAFLPTYLVTVKGIDGVTAGALFSLLFVCGAVAQIGGGRAATRYGYRPVLAGLAGFSVFPLVALPLVSGVRAAAVVVVLSGIQLGIAPVTNTYIIESLPAETRNSAWGFLRTGYFLIASTGSLFVGFLADAGRFDAAFFALGGLLAIASLVFSFLPSFADEG